MPGFTRYAQGCDLLFQTRGKVFAIPIRHSGTRHTNDPSEPDCDDAVQETGAMSANSSDCMCVERTSS
jgi:hypothetical protein